MRIALRANIGETLSAALIREQGGKENEDERQSEGCFHDVGFTRPGSNAEAKRRSFSPAYKKEILAEVDAAAGTGSIGELPRREGIYSSTLTGWRRERDTAIETAFTQKRGPEPKHNPFTAENEKLRRQNQRLQEELRKAEIIIDVQKKVAMLLGRPLPLIPDSDNS